MSIKIMSGLWGLDVPDSQLIVFLALADCANDEGIAWPSIATVAWKSRKSERTVQIAIKGLAEAGHLTREEVPGVGCRYYLHPRSDCTPARTAPPQRLRPRSPRTPPPQPLRGTPAAAAPNPSKNHHRTLPPNPQNGGRKNRVQFPDDWKAPALAELPPAAQVATASWPAGAYAGQAEAFVSYHRGKGLRAADWGEMWTAWIAKNHEAVMRSARGAAAYTSPSAMSVASETAMRRPVARPAAAKVKEDDRSSALHEALREVIGEMAWERWFASSALLFTDPGLTVIASTQTQRERIETEFSGSIDRALAVLGWGRDWIRFDVQASGRNHQKSAC